MFEKIVHYFLSLWNIDSESNEPKTDTVWFYVFFCKENYGNFNVFKLGYSHNVERHLVSSASVNGVFDKNKSFKVKLSFDEAKSLKKYCKRVMMGHSIHVAKHFSGYTDWFDGEYFYVLADDKKVSELWKNRVPINFSKLNTNIANNKYKRI